MNSFDEKPTVAGEPAPPAAPLPDLPGYAVEALVGRGGMGKVYRARHLGLGRVVAVKVFALELDENSLARFRYEAHAAARLQHPHIAQVFDSGSADGRPFLALEFVDGGSLAQKFAGRPQDPKAAAELVETVARAIQHCHDHGVLHRDLKPGNVLIGSDGAVKVTDFGLAKELPANGDTPRDNGGLTRTGEILGTPAYMPPEQASGVYATIGPAADVYALGAILYEALTGRPPFQAPDPLQTLFMVLGMDPVPPRTLQPKLPKDLETICLKCLEKSPRKRYASASALADDLRRFRTGEPILARPVGFLERAGKWARRRKAAAALLAVSVLFALALVGGAVWLAISNAQLAKAKKDVDDANADLTAAKSSLEQSNTDLRAANAESDKSFGLATDTLDRIVLQTTLKLNGVPKAEGVLLDTLAQATELNRQLVAIRPGDRNAGLRYSRGLMQQLAYEGNYGRREAADKTRAALRGFLAAELAKSPTDRDFRALEVRLAYNAAIAARPAGPTEPAKRVSALADAFAADFPDHPDARVFLVNKWWSEADLRHRAGDTAGQATALESAAVEARKMPAAGEAGRQRQAFLVSSLMQLGVVRQAREEYAAALDAFEEVARASESQPPSEDTRAGVAVATVKMATVRMDQGKQLAARTLFADAEPLLRQLAADFPLNIEYKLNQSECLYWLGQFEFVSDPDTGLKMIDESIRVLDALVIQDPKAQVYRDIRDGYLRQRKALAGKGKQTP